MTWQELWREHISVKLGKDQLLILQKALEKNDHKLIQGRTIQLGIRSNIIGACPIAYPYWDGSSHEMTLQNQFNKFCGEINEILGIHGLDPFLRWWDQGIREVNRLELLKEVNKSLEDKHDLAR